VIKDEAVEHGLINRYGFANITANVTDNSGVVHSVWAVIGIPGDGYSNESMDVLSGDVYNLSYQCGERGGYNATVWANDSSGNEDSGTLLEWDVYGWSNVSLEIPSGGSYSKGTAVDITCLVLDANLSSGVEGYPVEFWDEGVSLGVNYTNQSGFAIFQWDTTGGDDGGHDLNCTIGDNETLYYNVSAGMDYTTVELLAPGVNVTLIEHENLEVGLNEYESGDEIAWVNVTVNNTGGSPAGDVNVSLNILDGEGQAVSWFEEQSRDCGALQPGEECEVEFSPESIPGTAGAGGYYWNVTINWSGGDSPPEYNSSEGFVIHHLPDNISSDLEPVKVLQNESSVYNMTVENPWSLNITSVNVTVNCPENMTCLCLLAGQESQGYCELDNITSGGNRTASFNITTNYTNSPGEYDINSTVNYTNPGQEDRGWEEQGDQVLNVRGPTKLVVVITDYYLEVTRDGLYELKGYVNNTGTGVTNGVWINWSLPSGWSNHSGNLSLFNGTLCVGCLLWNNITANVSASAGLGTREVELRSESQEEAADWDTEDIDVYADTNVTGVWMNETGPYRNGSLRVEAGLEYDNGSAIEGEDLEFRLGGSLLGSNSTNSSGYAVLDVVVPYDAGLGSNVINVSYAGSSGIFANAGYNDTEIVDVQDELTIDNVAASPATQGYGNNVTLTADVWSRVSLDWVRVNLTHPNGSSYWIDMAPAGGGLYELVFGDTWQWGNYTYWVNASNLAGFGNDTSSQEQEFYVRANSTVDIETEESSYGPDQNVSLDKQEWWNRSYLYRSRVNVTEKSGSDLTDYQVNVTVNTSGLISGQRMQKL